MSFRTPFAVRAVAAASLALAGLVAAPGCKDSNGMMNGDSSTMDLSGMSKEQLMTKGQQLIDEGRALNDKADGMNGTSADPVGASRSDMMAKAKALIEKGEAMLSKAKTM